MMSDKILIPYNFTSAERKIIKTYFAIHSDWDKDVFDSIKKNIVKHLRTQQNNTCCYCKYELGFDIKQVDIEHIIPKSKYQKFTFHSKNLALSCPGCNTKKSIKNVVKRDFLNYPSSGNNIKIIHAHFDKYSEHISIYNKCVFVAKTIKGSETITFCELFRLSNAEKRAEKFVKNDKSLIRKLIQELKNPDSKDRAELISEIQDIIK